MKLEEFFEKYGDDEQMMGQIIEASKDENGCAPARGESDRFLCSVCEKI